MNKGFEYSMGYVYWQTRFKLGKKSDTTRQKSDTQFIWIKHWWRNKVKKKIKIVISFKSTRLRVDVNDFDLLNPKMKLFLRSVLYFEFYWVEKFDALKKRSKGSRRRTDPSNKYPTCLKTVRREQIVRLFAQTSLHTVGSARRTSSTHKSMEMYVGVEQA